MADFLNILKDFSNRFNALLPSFFPLPQGDEKRVVDAMFYSVSNGGKRLRPFLVIETAKLFNIEEKQALPIAAALEFIHCYSLIHDDLPAMDNDDLRRGKPTCHKQFDEATAILAGDGLLTYAFEILSDSKNIKDPETRCCLISLLSKAAGAFNGMVAGQMLDLSQEKNYDLKTVERLEEMKTGRLLHFACEAGAVLGKATLEQTTALKSYARKIGIAFQITDDLLDIQGNQELVGKTLNKDAEQGKMTFVDLYGVERANQMATQLIVEAKKELDIFGNNAEVLQELAQFILIRQS